MGATGRVAAPLALAAGGALMGSSGGGKGGATQGGASVPTAVLPLLNILNQSAQAGANASYLGDPFQQQGPGMASGIQAALLAGLAPAITGMSDISGFMPREYTPAAAPLFPGGVENQPAVGIPMDMTGSGNQGALDKLMTAYWGQHPPVQARAMGGPVAPGMPYLVGERGPEVITPQAPGLVLPTNVLGGGMGTAALPGGKGPSAANSAGGAANLPTNPGMAGGMANPAAGVGSGAGASKMGGAGGSGAGTYDGSGGVPGLFSTALSSMNSGINTGFLPQNMLAIENALNPALNRAWDQGSAQLREQGALTGNLSSTGTTSALTDLNAQLQNSKMQSLASIYGNALPSAMNIQSGLTTQGANLPGNILGWLQGPIGQGVQSAQYQQQLPISLMTGGTSGMSGVPMTANTYNPGKGQSLLSAGTQLGSAYIANH